MKCMSEIMFDKKKKSGHPDQQSEPVPGTDNFLLSNHTLIMLVTKKKKLVGGTRVARKNDKVIS